MHSFDAIILEKADHFLMMHRQEEFNRALEEAGGQHMRCRRVMLKNI